MFQLLLVTALCAYLAEAGVATYGAVHAGNYANVGYGTGYGTGYNPGYGTGYNTGYGTGYNTGYGTSYNSYAKAQPHNGYESGVNKNNANRQLLVNGNARYTGSGTGTARLDGVPGTPLGRTGHDQFSYGRGHGYGNAGYAQGRGNVGYGVQNVAYGTHNAGYAAGNAAYGHAGHGAGYSFQLNNGY